jgi:hypothetical protein
MVLLLFFVFIEFKNLLSSSLNPLVLRLEHRFLFDKADWVSLNLSLGNVLQDLIDASCNFGNHLHSLSLVLQKGFRGILHLCKTFSVLLLKFTLQRAHILGVTLI